MWDFREAYCDAMSLVSVLFLVQGVRCSRPDLRKSRVGGIQLKKQVEVFKATASVDRDVLLKLKGKECKINDQYIGETPPTHSA